MRLSTKGRYGLRAMVDLALNSEAEAVSISSISERQSISESYLEQLIAKLRRADLVVSTRGVQGGYRLTRPAEQITVGDVLRALEGDMRAVDCSAFDEEGCEGADLCVTKYVWQRINESIDAAMDDIYISQLVEESKKVMEKSREHPEEYPGKHCNG
ncbi:MAG: Rrf2 family transcriptional regulator [Lachnospiraceae bacterium]|nr:Rrf2 family transcriptional regulator [Lachnospiraceae bacterium]